MVKDSSKANFLLPKYFQTQGGDKGIHHRSSKRFVDFSVLTKKKLNANIQASA